MKKLIVIAILLTATLAFATTSILPPSGPTYVQVFTPTSIETVSAGSVTVSSYRAVMFDADETIYLNSDSSNTYTLVKNTPLGIGGGVTSIHVSDSAHMMVMQ